VRIATLYRSSFIDYPNKISCVIFTQGCNFRCSFCHNPELIDLHSQFNISEEEILSFLSKRRKLLDGVVICGGEPLLQLDLLSFILKIKEMNYSIKVDTNGSLPQRLVNIIQVIDYIAMDVKAPLNKYKSVINTDIMSEKIKESIEIIKNSGKGYEFRTTVVKTQLSVNDILAIGELIRDANLYVLQRFVPTKSLDKNFLTQTTYSVDEFNYIKGLLEASLVRRCIVR